MRGSSACAVRSRRRGGASSNKSFDRSRCSLAFIEDLNGFEDASGPVNSSVRFLLNGEVQILESVILNLAKRKMACVLMLMEGSEPRAHIES
jgi:hypothetical protein